LQEIIDSHHHLWDTDHLRYALFDTIPALNRPFTATDFDAGATCSGVSQSVCIEAASAGVDGLAEARWLLDQVGRSTVVSRLVAWAPLERADLRAYLDELRRIGGDRIVGVRRSFEFETPDFPGRAETIAGARLAAAYGYTVDLVLFKESLPAALDLVRACPEVQFILDHLGKPGIRERIVHPWQEQIAALAACDNVVCKISGLATEADRQNWRKEDFRPYISHAISCFGWDRVLFGSDWPVCEQATTYERWLEAVDWAVSDAAEADRQKLFAGNARRIYRFPSSRINVSSGWSA
jgi:predicted TIM-barrel fold metal-dependent hydrolase